MTNEITNNRIAQDLETITGDEVGKDTKPIEERRKSSIRDTNLYIIYQNNDTVDSLVRAYGHSVRGEVDLDSSYKTCHPIFVLTKEGKTYTIYDVSEYDKKDSIERAKPITSWEFDQNREIDNNLHARLGNKGDLIVHQSNQDEAYSLLQQLQFDVSLRRPYRDSRKDNGMRVNPRNASISQQLSF